VAIKKQTESGEFGTGSPQFTAIKSALDALEDYIGGKRKTPKVSNETLNGLNGIIAACKCKKCKSLNGFDAAGKDMPPSTWIAAPATTLTAAEQAAAQKIAYQDSKPSSSTTTAQAASQMTAAARAQNPSGFIIAPPIYKGKSNPITYASHRPLTSHVPTYNFNGRWQQLFNQPTKGFSALVYGQPKSGKSTMAIDLAGYLARGFGRVLYASIEEGGRSTLDERIRRLGVGHPNMDISNNLPADLSNYDFIITDSVSRGNLDLGQMQQLKADWPDKNFVFLFHTTKDGLPRGTNQFLHEVDVLVNVKDGVATADGRFGPGTMDVRFN
jgi:hypothetical protein